MGRYFKVRITENRQLSKEYNLLTLTPLSGTKEPEPGQFYMIGNVSDRDPLLKRPFSLFRKTSAGLQILYRVKGKGTITLRDRPEGTVMDVIGPLGNSYPIPDKEAVPLIIAGGIGIASVYSLIESFKGKAHVFYGARSADDLLFIDDLRQISGELNITTDDGSYGGKGNIIDALGLFLTQNSKLKTQNLVLYACGPKPMFEAINSLAREKKITTYISMEETMACGIGVCLGCVVKTVKGYERVCKEGPVFSIDKVVW